MNKIYKYMVAIGLILGSMHGICMAASVYQNFQDKSREVYVSRKSQAVELQVAPPIRYCVMPQKPHEAMIFAARIDNLDLLKKLIFQHKISVNIQNEWGWSALHAAAYYDRRAACEFILERKRVRVNLPNGNGETPFVLAIKNGHMQCAKLLLECGASPDGIDNNNTPLQLLLRGLIIYPQQDNLSVAERISFLLKSGANPYYLNSTEVRLLDKMCPGSFETDMTLLKQAIDRDEELGRLQEERCDRFFEGFSRPRALDIEFDNELVAIEEPIEEQDEYDDVL